MIKSPALFFADDVKIFCPIINGLNALQLQKGLLALKEWSKKWLMRFYTTKMVVMHPGNTNQKFSTWMNGCYKLCQNTIILFLIIIY